MVARVGARVGARVVGVGARVGARDGMVAMVGAAVGLEVGAGVVGSSDGKLENRHQYLKKQAGGSDTRTVEIKRSDLHHKQEDTNSSAIPYAA